MTAFKVSQNANPDLKWEQTSMLNIGLDFTLFDNRLNGTVEWYNKKTSDMLYTYKVPTPTYVYDKIAANVGDMSNKVIEILLNLDVIRSKNFTWNTSINLAHNKNEVTRLSNDLYSTDRVYVGDPWIRGASNVTSHVVEEGYPVGQFFMLKCNGIDENGKFIIEDINKDGQITDDDRPYCGDAQPDLTYGWNNTFSWKNWDLGFSLRANIGNYVYNNVRAKRTFISITYGNSTLRNLVHNDGVYFENQQYLSDYYLENAGFVRCDNITLGYTWNNLFNDNLRIRVYGAVQNPFVITRYKGIDPEVFSGVDNSTYPRPTSYTLGLIVTF